LKRSHAKILDLLSDDEHDDELENVLIMRDDSFREFVVELKSYLYKTKSTNNVRSDEPRPMKVVSSAQTKLPSLVIQQFDINIINWQGFWDQFHSAIHSKRDNFRY